MKIAVDAAGGDYAPHEIVKGAIKAADELGIEIVLVGRKNVLRALSDKALDKTGVTIVDAKQVIDFNEHPLRALQSKPDSSIVVGINLVKSGDADAFVSAGNTGAVFGAALLTLGKVEGITRPAIGCFPGYNIIPSGATGGCRR